MRTRQSTYCETSCGKPRAWHRFSENLIVIINLLSRYYPSFRWGLSGSRKFRNLAMVTTTQCGIELRPIQGLRLLLPAHILETSWGELTWRSRPGKVHLAIQSQLSSSHVAHSLKSNQREKQGFTVVCLLLWVYRNVVLRFVSPTAPAGLSLGAENDPESGWTWRWP